ncbi:MAG TPA: hypothetical protein VK037_05340 [Pseudogracilibacillus sp.]|nr:hypothetical protein [Pseudogracilibacillus sp.]
MTSFLLLLSFLIHLLLIITIYHLHEKLKKSKLEQLEQFEEVLASFMDEIREENTKLEQKLREEKVRRNVTYHRPITSSTPNFESNVAYQKNEDALSLRHSPSQEEDKVETSLESKVLQLQGEGKTVEEIAKQLNRGKTEVDLLLKLHRN